MDGNGQIDYEEFTLWLTNQKAMGSGGGGRGSVASARASLAAASSSGKAE